MRTGHPAVLNVSVFTNRTCPNCEKAECDLVVEMHASRIAKNSYSRAFFLAHLAFPEETTFPIVRCRHCRFVYAQRLLRADLLNALYERMIREESDRRHEESLDMTKVYAGVFTLLLHSVSVDADQNSGLKLLDFGGGTGAFCQVATAPHIEPICFETSERRVRLIRAKGLTVLDRADAILERAPYHMIFCNQVLEHVAQPKDVLRTFARILHPGGSAFLSVPPYPEEVLLRSVDLYRRGAEYPLDLNPWEHLNYFSPETFRRMLEDCGLQPYVWPVMKIDFSEERAVSGYMAKAHRNLPWTCAVVKTALRECAGALR